MAPPRGRRRSRTSTPAPSTRTRATSRTSPARSCSPPTTAPTAPSFGDRSPSSGEPAPRRLHRGRKGPSARCQRRRDVDKPRLVVEEWAGGSRAHQLADAGRIAAQDLDVAAGERRPVGSREAAIDSEAEQVALPDVEAGGEGRAAVLRD